MSTWIRSFYYPVAALVVMAALAVLSVQVADAQSECADVNVKELSLTFPDNDCNYKVMNIDQGWAELCNSWSSGRTCGSLVDGAEYKVDKWTSGWAPAGSQRFTASGSSQPTPEPPEPEPEPPRADTCNEDGYGGVYTNPDLAKQNYENDCGIPFQETTEFSCTWTSSSGGGWWCRGPVDNSTSNPNQPGGTGYGDPIWSDDFSKSPASSGKWHTPNWASGVWHDARNTSGQCTVSGDRLQLRASKVNGEVRSCYLASHEKFGPGDSNTIKIEYRVNTSALDAEGAWFAAWLLTFGVHPDGRNLSEDGNAATGSEIDVLEYIPYDKPDGTYSRTNWFHPAVHTTNSPPNGTAYATSADDNYLRASNYGVDMQRDQFNTWTLEWNRNCQVFSVNGRPYWKNTRYVSPAENHRLMLSIEADSANTNGSNLWNLQVGDFADNLDDDTAAAQVDWVRVWEKNSVDSGLCN